MSTTTQLAVIGAGPGGYAAAFLAADLGLEVTLIDPRSNPGGVCLYEGCIPSKVYLQATELIPKTQEAAHFGLNFGKPTIDIQKLRGWKQEVVAKLTQGLGQLNRSRKIRYIQGKACFISSNELEIDLGAEKKEVLGFQHAIIATGSRPNKPTIFPDSTLIMDSTDALKLESVPSSLLVLGGGYIGLEMGSIYANLGTKVSVVEIAGQLLPGTDTDLVRPLAKNLERSFEKIYLNTQITATRIESEKVWVSLQENSQQDPEKTKDYPLKEESFDKMLVCVGRRPYFSDLGLENTDVRLTDMGFIDVDPSRRSTAANIYAIGDATGPPMLAHKASHEGKVAVEAICGKKTVFAPYAIPAVVFTDPELAYCGIMEQQAKENGYNEVKVARFPWSASGRAVSLGVTEGLTKVVIDSKTNRLIGLGIVGKGAGDLIAEGVLAIEMGASAEDIALSIHPHPTLSETLMECSEMIFGKGTHLHRP